MKRFILFQRNSSFTEHGNTVIIIHLFQNRNTSLQLWLTERVFEFSSYHTPSNSRTHINHHMSTEVNQQISSNIKWPSLQIWRTSWIGFTNFKLQSIRIGRVFIDRVFNNITTLSKLTVITNNTKKPKHRYLYVLFPNVIITSKNQQRIYIFIEFIWNDRNIIQWPKTHSPLTT